MGTSYLLALLLFATPGPLDRLGGHLNPVTAEYHFHALASYQFRYLDAQGRIWEGNGPRPEENLSYAPDNFLWATAFIPLLVLTSLVAGFGAWRIEDRIRAAIARRHRRGRRAAFVTLPGPRIDHPPLAWSVRERHRDLERRRVAMAGTGPERRIAPDRRRAA